MSIYNLCFAFLMFSIQSVLSPSLISNAQDVDGNYSLVCNEDRQTWKLWHLVDLMQKSKKINKKIYPWIDRSTGIIGKRTQTWSVLEELCNIANHDHTHARFPACTDDDEFRDYLCMLSTTCIHLACAWDSFPYGGYVCPLLNSISFALFPLHF